MLKEILSIITRSETESERKLPATKSQGKWLHWRILPKHTKKNVYLSFSKYSKTETTMRYHLTPVRTTVLKKSTNNPAAWTLIKRKHFCTAKKTINRTRRQLSEWENICKWSKRQGISLQNIQTAHEAQYQKNKQHN